MRILPEQRRSSGTISHLVIIFIDRTAGRKYFVNNVNRVGLGERRPWQLKTKHYFNPRTSRLGRVLAGTTSSDSFCIMQKSAREPFLYPALSATV